MQGIRLLSLACSVLSTGASTAAVGHTADRHAGRGAAGCQVALRPDPYGC